MVWNEYTAAFSVQQTWTMFILRVGPMFPERQK